MLSRRLLGVPQMCPPENRLKVEARQTNSSGAIRSRPLGPVIGFWRGEVGVEGEWHRLTSVVRVDNLGFRVCGRGLGLELCGTIREALVTGQDLLQPQHQISLTSPSDEHCDNLSL